jgi:hypothetical protein
MDAQSFASLAGAIRPGDPPPGTMFCASVVIGVDKFGSHRLNARLPSGVAYDSNDPAHVLARFVCENARMLAAMAWDMRGKSLASEQRDENVATSTLLKP